MVRGHNAAHFGFHGDLVDEQIAQCHMADAQPEGGRRTHCTKRRTVFQTILVPLERLGSGRGSWLRFGRLIDAERLDNGPARHAAHNRAPSKRIVRRRGA